MLELKQIQYFIACAECGSFSDAANILFTTQSNVSKVIRALEDELNIKLFERHIRGISLTAEGEAIYRNAVKIQSHVDEIIQNAKLYTNTAEKENQNEERQRNEEEKDYSNDDDRCRCCGSSWRSGGS